jgi:hypothetical protein
MCVLIRVCARVPSLTSYNAVAISIPIILLFFSDCVCGTAVLPTMLARAGYAREHQPCIIFMDEIDAIGGRRFSEGTSSDREIQRTLMEVP